MDHRFDLDSAHELDLFAEELPNQEQNLGSGNSLSSLLCPGTPECLSTFYCYGCSAA
jgi:hypothetical protein